MHPALAAVAGKVAAGGGDAGMAQGGLDEMYRRAAVEGMRGVRVTEPVGRDVLQVVRQAAARAGIELPVVAARGPVGMSYKCWTSPSRFR
jgi:hypothetical protein